MALVLGKSVPASKEKTALSVILLTILDNLPFNFPLLAMISYRPFINGTTFASSTIIEIPEGGYNLKREKSKVKTYEVKNHFRAEV